MKTYNAEGGGDATVRSTTKTVYTAVHVFFGVATAKRRHSRYLWENLYTAFGAINIRKRFRVFILFTFNDRLLLIK